MTPPAASKACRFAWIAAGVAAPFGVLTVAVAFLFGKAAIGWGLLGWGLMAWVGSAGGAWMAARHGTPGSGFYRAMIGTMLVRMFTVSVGAGLAAWSGGVAPWAYLGGAVAGFAPLQVFEVVWFYRAGRESEPGGGTGY